MTHNFFQPVLCQDTVEKFDMAWQIWDANCVLILYATSDFTNWRKTMPNFPAKLQEFSCTIWVLGALELFYFKTSCSLFVFVQWPKMSSRKETFAHGWLGKWFIRIWELTKNETNSVNSFVKKRLTLQTRLMEHHSTKFKKSQVTQIFVDRRCIFAHIFRTNWRWSANTEWTFSGLESMPSLYFCWQRSGLKKSLWNCQFWQKFPNFFIPPCICQQCFLCHFGGPRPSFLLLSTHLSVFSLPSSSFLTHG